MKRKNVGLIYLKKSLNTLVRHPNVLSIFSLVKYFSEWRTYLAPDRNSVADKIPWMTFSAIDFLEKIAHLEMKVFEYGSGGSTLFWSSRVKDIISVEHDKPWFEKIKAELAREQTKNVNYILSESHDISDFGKKQIQIATDYISSDPNYTGKSFEAYVKTIDNFPDENFDVIVIDGRARPSCILHSLKKVKRGGYLVVDNSERKYYLAGFDFSKWKSRNFFGPVPYSCDFSKTTIFQKM